MKLFWTQARIIRAIQALDRAGVSLSTKDSQYDRSSKTSRIIFRCTRRRITGSSFFAVARDRFGSWRAALKAAGISDDAHVKHRKYWKQDHVVSAIQALSDAGVSLRSTNLTWDTSTALTGIISERTGLAVSGSKLVNGARSQFGSWSSALLAAGAPVPEPSRRRIRMQPRKTPLTMTWTMKQLHEMIRLISSLESDLRVGHLLADCKQSLKPIISTKYDNLILLNVFGLSRDMHGTWKKSIVMAGLDPRYYLKSKWRSAKNQLTHDPRGVQIEYRGDGLPTRMLHIGEIEPDPEASLLNEEFHAHFQKKLRKLNPKQRSITESILRVIDEGSSHSDLLQNVIRASPGYSEMDVKSTLFSLQKSLVEFRN